MGIPPATRTVGGAEEASVSRNLTTSRGACWAAAIRTVSPDSARRL